MKINGVLSRGQHSANFFDHDRFLFDIGGTCQDLITMTEVRAIEEELNAWRDREVNAAVEAATAPLKARINELTQRCLELAGEN